MLFTTIYFLKFLGILVPIYWLLVWLAPKYARKYWLFLGACVFWWYSVGEPLKNLYYIGVSLAGNYALYLLLTKKRDAKGLWIISAFNLGVLFYYSFFFFQAISSVSPDAGKTFGYYSPLGISFYSLAFLQFHFDLYKSKKETSASVVDFLVFGSFFAVSNAGPILRWRRFQEELPSSLAYFLRCVPKGLGWLCLGILKRVVLSESLQSYVDPIYSAPSGFTRETLLLNVYINAFQMYLDFSGFVDIGRGAAKLLGYDLPINFRAPFFAASIREYIFSWNRTLGVFFREVVYYRLRKTKLYAPISLAIACILYSFWYRISWNSILFAGILFGILTTEHWIRFRTKWNFLNQAVRILISFHLMAILWFILRCEKWELLAGYTNAFLEGGTRVLGSGENLGILFAVAILIQSLEKKYRRFFY